MGLVHRRELLSLFIWIALGTWLSACGEIEDPRRAARGTSRTVATQLDSQTPTAERSTLYEPPVANGEPMPPAETAGGVPPYPNATVYIRNRQPQTMRRFEAFTFDSWDQVVEFYHQELPTWTYRQARDTAIFVKEPDQASITITPWDYQDLPDDAPEVLRRARTAIGAAWR